MTNIFDLPSVQAKAEAMVELLGWLDYECSAKEKEAVYQELDPRVQAALEELWVKFYDCPKHFGRWSGEPCDSVWIPDDEFVPINKAYSNLHGLSWRNIKLKHGFAGMRCERGRWRFDEIARYKVTLPNFAELVASSDREALHEAAFAALAKQLGKSVAEVKAIKESAYDKTIMGQKNLVWHEDVDCATLYLVPQEIHGNIKHFGGVGMCQLLRKHGIIR